MEMTLKEDDQAPVILLPPFQPHLVSLKASSIQVSDTAVSICTPGGNQQSVTLSTRIRTHNTFNRNRL